MGTVNEQPKKRLPSAFLSPEQQHMADNMLSGYALPAFRADAETGADMLLCMTGGTPLTIDQYRRIFRQKREVPNLMLLLMAISYLILFTWVIGYSWDYASMLTGILLYAVALIGAIVQLGRYRTRYNRQRYYAARCKGDVADAVMEIYTDRAVKTSARGQTVIRFREADMLYEWPDMLCLRCGHYLIAWRSADLTESQAALIRKLVYARIEPARRCFFGKLQYACDLPKPIPEMPDKETQVHMIYQPVPKKKRIVCRDRVKHALPLLACVTVPPTLVIATQFEITGIHMVDIALFWLAVTAGAAVLMWLLQMLAYRPDERQIPALLSVTDTGIAIVRGDMTMFFLRSDMDYRYTEHGLWIMVPNETFWIHLKDISDPATLQAMLPRRAMK